MSETSFNPTDVSAAAQIQRIKGARPQAVIAWSTAPAIGTVFKAIADAAIDVPVATTDGNMTYASMQRYADILPRRAVYPVARNGRAATHRTCRPPVAAAKDAFFAAYHGDGREAGRRLAPSHGTRRCWW